MHVQLDLSAANFLREQVVPVHVNSDDSPDCSEYAIHHCHATKTHQHYTTPLDPNTKRNGNKNKKKLNCRSGIRIDLEPCLK